MARRSYTDAQRERALAVLATNDGNYTKTESETGVQRATLRRWAKADIAQSPAITALKKEFADAYRDKLKRARESALDRMLELIPKECDLHKVTGAAKILSEISITQDVVDEYNRPEASASAASGAALSQDPASTTGTYN